jgi:hypothetical protein
VVKYLLTALVEERKNREAEFTPAITQVTDVLSVDIIDRGAAPFVVFNEPANDRSISISGADASMGEDPLEVAPPTVPILATSTEEIAEPLSELLAEIPERPPESSFYPPATDWVGPFPPQTSPEYVLRQTAELIPIDHEQPLAETAAERSPKTSTKTEATDAAEEPSGFPGRDDRNEY